MFKAFLNFRDFWDVDVDRKVTVTMHIFKINNVDELETTIETHKP